MGSTVEREITHGEALRALRAEYYTDVKDMAEDLVSRVKAGKITDEEELDDAAWEDCDSSQWVIYTGKNWQLLLVSDNESAYFDEGIGDGSELVSGDGLRTEVLAFHALRADLREALVGHRILDTLGTRNLFDEEEDSDATE